jgi:hypothetical protein
MSNELYQKMKARGLDVSWYEKVKALGSQSTKGSETPLSSEYCSLLSIYLIDTEGKLWTTTPDGKRYMIARHTKNRPKQNTYACVSCKTYYKTYKDAVSHYDSK